MKNVILIVLLSLSMYSSTLAQQIIAVQTLTDVAFYTDLTSAIDNAPDGSTIHLPGGHFSYSPIIDKKLHLVGVGHHPDSTNATSQTYINGNLKITSGMTGGSITGIYIIGDLEVLKDGGGNSGFPPDNVLLKRCNLKKLTYGSNTTNPPKLWNVDENYFRDSTENSISGWFQNSVFSNNVIHGRLWAVHVGCSFDNNVFLKKTGNLFQNGMNGVSFTKNVFYNNNINTQLNSAGAGGMLNFTFNENIFQDALDAFPINTHTGSDNMDDIGGDLLVDISNLSVYDNNYHINPSLGFAFDGDDNELFGLYNVDKIFKDGSLPSNPHIRIKQIEPVTDATGKLKVKIEVVSQQN